MCNLVNIDFTLNVGIMDIVWRVRMLEVAWIACSLQQKSNAQAENAYMEAKKN